MTNRLFLLALLSTAWATDAMAQRVAPIIGVGGFSCGQYLAHRQSDGESYTAPQTGVYVSWVFGYLSGYNYFSYHLLIDLPEPNTVVAYLDKYCRNNPLKIVATGAECLIAETGGSRPKYCKPE